MEVAYTGKGVEGQESRRHMTKGLRRRMRVIGVIQTAMIRTTRSSTATELSLERRKSTCTSRKPRGLSVNYTLRWCTKDV